VVVDNLKNNKKKVRKRKKRALTVICVVGAASESKFNLVISSGDAHRPFGLVWPCE
jgi:hypothetical protein